MTNQQIAIFLTHLRTNGLEATAAEAAGVSLRTVKAYMRTDDDFADAVEDAMERAFDRDEAEARRRAVEGVEEPVIYQGNVTYLYEDVTDEDGNLVTDPDTGIVLRRPVLDENGNHKILTVKKYSDTLLAQRLKGRRRRVYGDKTEVSGPNGGPVEVFVRQFALPAQQQGEVIDVTPNYKELANELA